MIPSKKTASWVGRSVICNTCGRGWILEAGDIIESSTELRGGIGISGSFINYFKIKMPCSHEFRWTVDEWVKFKFVPPGIY
jgi:hypothetical protein